MSNTFGSLLRFTIFGDSHGKAVGGILDGFPPGMLIDLGFLQHQLERRSSHGQKFGSGRREPDKVEFLSGVRNGITSGGPLAFMICNTDARPGDYTALDPVFRPSHADYTFYKKYGTSESAGKLHASARNMAALTAAGTLARQFLLASDIRIAAWVSRIGNISLKKDYLPADPDTIDESPVRCPDINTSDKMVGILRDLQQEGDTAGGIISTLISGYPAGLGDPVFGKLQAKLAHAMFSIPSVKGFEYGEGFGAASFTGTQHNDPFVFADGSIKTSTNHSGGIQGGISNGAEIRFNVGFKPVPGIRSAQQTVDRNGKAVKIKIGGRHDTCIVPRAVPLVEALASLVLLDAFLTGRAYEI